MMNKTTDHKEGGVATSQDKNEYIKQLEVRLIEQANEILRLKRKINGVKP